MNHLQASKEWQFVPDVSIPFDIRSLHRQSETNWSPTLIIYGAVTGYAVTYLPVVIFKKISSMNSSNFDTLL